VEVEARYTGAKGFYGMTIVFKQLLGAALLEPYR